MSYELTSSEMSAVSMLSPEGRYDYFVAKVAGNREIWSLEGDDGWVVMRSEDGDECLPIWPHADFAAQWADGDWAGCRPAAIELDAWMERWTPGMEQDGTLLAVFPDEEGEGTIVTPTELHASIEGALKKQ